MHRLRQVDVIEWAAKWSGVSERELHVWARWALPAVGLFWAIRVAHGV